MIRITKILYSTDFSSHSNQAYFHAVALAEKHGASLTIAFVYSPSFLGTAEFLQSKTVREDHRVVLHQPERYSGHSRELLPLLDELADAIVDGTRREYVESVSTVPLLIIDDFGMRKLPHTAAEDLLEIIMRRYERFSTLLTSNRPVEDWGKLLGDVAAVSAMLDRLLHHGHVLKCGPRSWRTKAATTS